MRLGSRVGWLVVLRSLQEDGEQVTEEDISALYQDASLRLRTSLREKVAPRSNVVRKSLRQKIGSSSV